mgnify:CR=1 FL=1
MIRWLEKMIRAVRLTFIGSIITAFCGQFLGYISTRGRGKWYGMKVSMKPEIKPFLARGRTIFPMRCQKLAPLMSAASSSSTAICTGNGYGLQNLTLYNWIGTLDEAQTYTSMEGIFRNAEFGAR